MTEPIVLYVVPASHPCIAVETGLALKRLDYRRVDLMFGLSAAQQMLRFGRRTVPGLTVGSQKVVDSRLILRTIDGLEPTRRWFRVTPSCGPRPTRVRRAGVGIRFEGRLLGPIADRVRDEYLPALPRHLDHVDELIASGVIGTEDVNVADLQIAASVRLLLTFEDLRGHIETRPCGILARRLIADYPGSCPRGALRSPLTPA